MSDKAAMEAFVEKIQPKLDHYGPVHLIDNKDGSVEVPAEGERGFVVRASVEDKEIVAAYGHWHDYFESDDEAPDCFMSGVFGEARLAVTKHGSFAHSWTAEVLNDGSWVPVSTTAYFLFPSGSGAPPNISATNERRGTVTPDRTDRPSGLSVRVASGKAPLSDNRQLITDTREPTTTDF